MTNKHTIVSAHYVEYYRTANLAFFFRNNKKRLNLNTEEYHLDIVMAEIELLLAA